MDVDVDLDGNEENAKTGWGTPEHHWQYHCRFLVGELAAFSIYRVTMYL